MIKVRIFSWPREALIGFIRFYRFALSPWLGNACRFEPTCSAYALQALNEHGAAAGTYLTLRRIARCAPWCAGGHDPVPTTRPKPFTFAVVPVRPPRNPSTAGGASPLLSSDPSP